MVADKLACFFLLVGIIYHTQPVGYDLKVDSVSSVRLFREGVAFSFADIGLSNTFTADWTKQVT
ncbi:hypothetical protein PRUB_a2626 [Pseudoalteromonas rubra]|uniref:Uncharacterized protein n=1 Tax=Pseudoalteromonas rubra TaxID=43658 RepID=A0A8T0CDH4_9GAMM|nr:hypothetical protein PRUB_a2626 [Pseudoalteromonas rubra]